MHRLTCLGTLRLDSQSAGSPTFAAHRKRLALLAVLAAAGEAGVPRDRLLLLLWPESDTDHARNALKQLLFAIRSELGPVFAGPANADPRLDPAAITSDVDDFRAALQRGDLEAAVASYSGPFLDGFYVRDVPDFERWAEEERQRLSDAYAEALEKLARAAAEKNPDVAARLWKQLTAARPLSAQVAREYVAALDAAGDRASALQYASSYTALVRSELGADPDPAFVATINQLREAPSTPALGGGQIRPRQQLAGVLSQPTRSRPTRKRVFATVSVVAAVGLITMLAFADTPVTVTVGRTTRVTMGPSIEDQVAISPDGKLVAYVAGSPERMLYVQQVGADRAIPLALTGSHMNGWPAWSPDGREIAFATDSGVYVIPALGGPARHVARQRRVTGIDWSPDSSTIAYATIGEGAGPYERPGGVWTQPLGGGPPRLVTNAVLPHSPRWSPDGTRILYVTGNTSPLVNVAPATVWITTVTGGESARISDLEHLNNSAAWMPGGQHVLYVSNRDGVRDVYVQPLRSGRYPEGDPIRLTAGANIGNLSVSADGRTLAYTVMTRHSTIWAAPILPNRATPMPLARDITSEKYSVEGINVSRDGRWLIYDANKTGNQHLFKMPSGGGESVQLTHNPGENMQGEMSPDGREVVFYSLQGGNRDIFLISADGQNLRKLTSDPGQEYFPSWSPDGNRISFVSNRTGRFEIYVISRLEDGRWSEWRQLTDRSQSGNNARWSPDGRYIAFTRGGDSVALLTPDDGRIRIVATAPQGHGVRSVWSTDSKALYLVFTNARGEGSYWAVPVDGGKPRRVLADDEAVRQPRPGGMAIHGNRIIFPVSRDESDVWVMELISPKSASPR